MFKIPPRNALQFRTEVRSFLGARFLDRGGSAKVEECMFEKLSTRSLPKAPWFGIGEFPVVKQSSAEERSRPGAKNKALYGI